MGRPSARRSERALNPTLGALVESIAQRFLGADLYFGHGAFEAFDEALFAVLHTLGLPLDELETN